jgi:apolipoprotein N-acyltransferase
MRLGPLICYEAIFPETARSAVRAGADLLVNISNDAWFSHPAGAAQHYLFSRARAVEFRRTLVRVANRGTTAVVLPDGSTAIATDGRTPGLEIASVPRLETITPYARLGDAFAWTCVAGVAATLARSAWRRRPGARMTRGNE